MRSITKIACATPSVVAVIRTLASFSQFGLETLKEKDIEALHNLLWLGTKARWSQRLLLLG
jgi:hypothetical protein